jgi:hypothetical protein
VVDDGTWRRAKCLGRVNRIDRSTKDRRTHFGKARGVEIADVKLKDTT